MPIGTFAEFPIDCEEERILRAVLVGMLCEVIAGAHYPALGDADAELVLESVSGGDDGANPSCYRGLRKVRGEVRWRFGERPKR